MEYVYIVRVRESVRMNENVYKIGRTTQIVDKRISHYPKNTEVYHISNVTNSAKIEAKILLKFKEKFRHAKEFGNEYFEGNIDNMITLIEDIVRIDRHQKSAYYKVNLSDNDVSTKNDLVNDNINELVNDKINELVNDKINELVNDKINELVNDNANELVNDKINELVNDKINELVNDNINVSYNCVSCDKPFKYKSDYERHINRKTPCNENDLLLFIQKKKTCRYCNKVFKRADSIPDHLTICKVKLEDDKLKEKQQNEIDNKIILEQLLKEMHEMKQKNLEMQNEIQLLKSDNCR